jgi:hypothetical protein
MKLITRTVGLIFIGGAIILGSIVAISLYGFLIEIASHLNRGWVDVVARLFVTAILALLALGLGWLGYWTFSDNPSNVAVLRQQWRHSLGQPRRKGQIPTLLLTYFFAPLAFLYVGGWRVFVPIAIVGIGFDILFMTINPEMAKLGEFGPLLFSPSATAPLVWPRAVGLVFFLHALRYLHVYNKGFYDGRSVEDLQSFKWGWYVCIAISYGLALIYMGVLIFISILAWSGSVLKAMALCLSGLYLTHHGMRWIQKRLVGFLATRYSVTPTEFIIYQPFRYPNYLF